MPFTSPVFLACLVPFVFGFHLASPRFRTLILVVLTAVFYTAVNPWWALLLATLTGLTFVAGLNMALSERRRPIVFPFAILALLSTLAFFKYGPQLMHQATGGRSNPLDGMWLPLGISYYTFKLLSYVVDVHWGKLPPERDFLAFAAYASFLPQLPSGPIQRSGDFFAQLRSPSASVASGLRLILFGLFQKLVIADRAGEWVDPVFADSGVGLDPVSAVLAIYAYAIQLYADFSGISDIAIGMGRLFEIEAPPNFRSPYLAESLSEFWRRWHMSMTSWINDYVFMPLRMLLRSWGTAGLIVCLMVNMFLIGLWHAATPCLLGFGVLHGALMVCSVLTRKRRDAWFKRRPRLQAARSIWRPILTFHTVALTLIIFRAPTLTVANRVFLQALRGWTHLASGAPVAWKQVFFVNAWGFKEYREDLCLIGFGLLTMAVVHRKPGMGTWLLARPTWLRWSCYYAAVIVVVVLAKPYTANFIYARF